MLDQIEKSEHPRCTFFVLRKKRSCRMFVKPGKSFCGEHTLIQSKLEHKEEQNKEGEDDEEEEDDKEEDKEGRRR